MNIQSRPLEKIEKMGDGRNVIGFKGCKDMNQVFQVALAKFTKQGNEEARQVTLMLQQQFKRFDNSQQTKRLLEEKKNEIELVGWKGEGNLSINKTYLNDFVVKEYIKNKETGEAEPKITVVTATQVNNLLRIIRSYPINEKVSYRELVDRIIGLYRLNIETDAFNGGRNRARAYFPLYYYPLKILELLGLVQYFGGGGMKRLR